MSGRRKQSENLEQSIVTDESTHGELVEEADNRDFDNNDDGNMNDVVADETAIADLSKLDSVVGPVSTEEVSDLIEPVKEPNFESWNDAAKRKWLKDHDIKGTWSKKLTEKCRAVWDDLHAPLSSIAASHVNPSPSKTVHDDVIADPDTAANEDLITPVFYPDEPDWTKWTPDRKRQFLRKRNVKGIWIKHLDLKCSEIWRIEKSGEKYVHIPPSLSKTPNKTSSSNQNNGVSSPTKINDVSTDTPTDLSPLLLNPLEFREMIEAARQQDLKSLSKLLDQATQQNVEKDQEYEQIQSENDNVSDNRDTNQHLHQESSNSSRAVDTLVETPPRYTDGKRPSNTNVYNRNSKRRKMDETNEQQQNENSIPTTSAETFTPEQEIARLNTKLQQYEVMIHELSVTNANLTERLRKYEPDFVE